MLAFLWRVLIVLTALWLIRTLLGYYFPQLRNMGRPSPKRAGEPHSKKMVKDPVCGMYIDPRLALPLISGKETAYFCSQACLEKYKKDQSA